MTTYNKLVRDKIPQIIKASGNHCEFKILDNTDYEEALKTKLLEEMDEVQAANTDEELIEELADLYEVLSSLVLAKGVSEERFLEIVKAKNEKRGSFKEKIYLIRVGQDN